MFGIKNVCKYLGSIGMFVALAVTFTLCTQDANAQKARGKSAAKTKPAKEQTDSVQNINNRPTAAKKAAQEKYSKDANADAEKWAEDNNGVGIGLVVGMQSALIQQQGIGVFDQIKTAIEARLKELGLPHRVEVEIREGAGITATISLKGHVYEDEITGEGLFSLRGLSSQLGAPGEKTSQVARQFSQVPDNVPKDNTNKIVRITPAPTKN